MAGTVQANVGQTVKFSVLYYDQTGKQMAAPADAAITWSNNSAEDTLTPHSATDIPPGPSFADVLCTAAGTDIIKATVVSGGKTFSDDQTLTIIQPSVLTSIQLVSNVV